MPNGDIAYKSYCWSLGTTSFRTKNFNLTIERQLQLLDEFWSNTDNINTVWTGNNALQEQYYLFMLENGFVKGDAPRKAKDAREKTSGLVDIGLIDDNRHLTEAGTALLNISLHGDFTSDNDLDIPKDSFVYFKQLLKTSNNIGGNVVRPFIILSYLLSKLEYLTMNEYTYILPLCTTKEITENMIGNIKSIRDNTLSIDDVIINLLMGMDNYQEALNQLLSEEISEDLICRIGINRKSRQYDKAYYPLYLALKEAIINHNSSEFITVYNATKDVNIGLLWRKYLFNTLSATAIERSPQRCLRKTPITKATTIEEFNIEFFRLLHLCKARATMSDYLDLNRRYFKITDTILFEDGKIHFDIVPKQFISSIANELFEYAFIASDKLTNDCRLDDIAPCLVVNEVTIINGINHELGLAITTMAEARVAVNDERLKRFNDLIDSKFDDNTLISLLDKFESRADEEIFDIVTDNADAPTIFEYILGVIWYKLSERKGNILSYMNLSLEADLLPKTHAGGGEADIEYWYAACDEYPEHCMLLEATLADGTNQRRMEMEPVSRHLGEHILKYDNKNSYCVFSTTYLDRNVISDFRSRKSTPYFQRGTDKYVDGIKIIPLQTSELKEIIRNNITYKKLYEIFVNAYQSNESVVTWYENNILMPAHNNYTRQQV